MRFGKIAATLAVTAGVMTLGAGMVTAQAGEPVCVYHYIIRR